MHSSAYLMVVLTGMAIAAPSRAQSVTPLKPLPAIQLEVVRGLPELDGARFSLGFSEPTPINDVLMLLVRQTRFSVIPAPGLDQRFIGDLKNVTLREALDLILEPMALDYSVRGSVIRVFPREFETRIYNIDRVITQRTGRRSAGGTTEVVSTDAPDLFADLAAGVRALLSTEGRFSIDRTAGLLQVVDRSSRLARVEQYLETAMLRAMKQVQIDARIVDVQLADDHAAGIDWRVALRDLPRTGAAPDSQGTTTMIVTATDFNVLLAALRAQGAVNVLASPAVTAMNNEPAVMRVATHDAQTLTDGVALSVTPQIGVDGMIHMSVTASVTGPATAASPSSIALREADTVVHIRQGETAVIAGLLRDHTPDAAAAGDRSGRRKTETVILITPTILQPRAAVASPGAR